MHRWRNAFVDGLRADQDAHTAKRCECYNENKHRDTLGLLELLQSEKALAELLAFVSSSAPLSPSSSPELYAYACVRIFSIMTDQQHGNTCVSARLSVCSSHTHTHTHGIMFTTARLLCHHAHRKEHLQHDRQLLRPTKPPIIQRATCTTRRL